MAILIAGLWPAAHVCAQQDASFFRASVPTPGVDPLDLMSNCFIPLLYESPYDTNYVITDFVAFRRDWQHAQTYATRDTPTNNVLNTHDLPFVFEPGLRVLIGRRISDWHAIEASFVGLLSWNEVRSVRDHTPNALGTIGNLFSPFGQFGDTPLVGFDFNDFASIRVVSTMSSAEINLRQRYDTPPSCLQCSGLLGVRYLNIQDRFSYRTQSAEASPAGTANAINVDCGNSLIGVQVGAMLDFRIETRWWLNLEAKGLLLYNDARQSTEFFSGPLAGGGTLIEGDATQGRATLGADLTGMLMWKISPRFVARFGYQAILLDGLALGSDNFMRNLPSIPVHPNQLDDTGHLVYHGPFAGITATW